MSGTRASRWWSRRASLVMHAWQSSHSGAMDAANKAGNLSQWTPAMKWVTFAREPNKPLRLIWLNSGCHDWPCHAVTSVTILSMKPEKMLEHGWAYVCVPAKWQAWPAIRLFLPKSANSAQLDKANSRTAFCFQHENMDQPISAKFWTANSWPKLNI